MVVTVQQIAKAANVAVPTAYEALRGAGRLSDQTRSRVTDAARRLGYRPNAGARAIRTGRAGAIGLLMSLDRRRRYLPSDLLEGIHDALAQRDLHLTYAKLPDEKLTDQAYVPKILREWAVDGLLINYTHEFPPEMAGLIRKHRIPSIWLNVRRDRDAVYPDDESAGRLATQYLLDQGHRRIAYLMLIRPGSATHDSVSLRSAGYAGAMVDAGLTPDVQTLAVDERPEDGGPIDTRLAVLSDWFNQVDRPTAVVTYSAWTAEPLLHAALLAGVRVPQDLRVVNLGGLMPTTGAGVALTQMLLDLNQLGQEAVQLLVKKIESPNQALPSVSLPMRLVTAST